MEAMISLVESVTESSNMKESISTGILTSYYQNSNKKLVTNWVGTLEGRREGGKK